MIFVKGKHMNKNQEAPTYLEPSYLLDYRHPTIEQLIRGNGWNSDKDHDELIGDIFTFVRDEIEYGFSRHSCIRASQVLAEGMGDSIPKSTLFMALLRAVGVPCRFYAMTMRTLVFRGLLPKFRQRLAAKNSYAALVEIRHKGRWYAVDRHVIDKPYIESIVKKHPYHIGGFYGYGIATLDFNALTRQWNENHLNKKSRVVEQDLGAFTTPDRFFSQVPEAQRYTQSLSYKAFLRDSLNKSIQVVRNSA
jgi:hypothetical protein